MIEIVDPNDGPLARFYAAKQVIRRAEEAVVDAIADAVRAEFPSAKVEIGGLDRAYVHFGKNRTASAVFKLLQSDWMYEVSIGFSTRRSSVSFRDALEQFGSKSRSSPPEVALMQACLAALEPPKEPRSCKYHVDCDVADDRARRNGRLRANPCESPPGSFQSRGAE